MRTQVRNPLFPHSPWRWLGPLSLLCLGACSSPSETFDSEPGKGAGARPISAVNTLVNQGGIPGIAPEVQPGAVSVPVLRPEEGPHLVSEKIMLSDHTVVKRAPEQYVRVWIAPYQDSRGNFHEGSVVHTVLKPSYWEMRPVVGREG
jgi:conjugal transfer pilus assembly protein TraV